VDNFDITVSHDIAADGLRVDWMRNWLFFGGLPATYSEIVSGQLGYIEGTDSAFGPDASPDDMPSARWASIVKQHRLLNPQLILKDIAADPSIASEAGAGLHNGAIHELLVVQDDVHPITLWINASTGRIAKLTTMENDHLFRDMTLEVHYHDWSTIDGGIAFPNSVYLLLGTDIMHEEYRSVITVNPALEATLFDFPPDAAPMYVAADAIWGETSHQFFQGFKSLGLPFDVPQTYVAATELSPGVWFLAGGSHNSMVVEQAAGLVVIEPPLYPERSAAILAWIAAEPALEGKPVTHVFVTHHHHDHSAGVREFAAAGATVVVSEVSKGFFSGVLSAPSTISPDSLAQNPVPATIATVPQGDMYTAADATHPVTAYHMQSGHADDLIMVYVNGYLFESDLYNPGNGGQAIVPAFAVELRGAISASAPGTTTVVGGHGAYAPLSELDEYIAALP
jgi:glyoxylase-like metal-dependent hydrolase (beta-lactamase superfamily II)